MSDKQYYQYYVSDRDIATALSSESGIDILRVPHLSVLKDVRSELTNTISSVSSELSNQAGRQIEDISAYLDGLDYSESESDNKIIVSSIIQTDGKISVGRRELKVGDISSLAIIPDDFSKRLSNRRIRFEYDSTGKAILLGVDTDDTTKENMLSIDCTDFIKDGMLDRVETSSDIMGPYIKLVWNTESGKTDSIIYVKQILDGIYKGVSPIVIDQDSLSISLDLDALKTQLGYNELWSYYQFLAGLGEWADQGAIKTISDDISTLFKLGAKDLKYIGHINDPGKLSVRTLVDYFTNRLVDLTSIWNGSFLPVEFEDNHMKISTTDDTNPLVVGNGDIVVIHSHGDETVINVEDLSVGKNVYVIKAGVSRYEYEGVVDDFNTTSSWINDNFKEFPLSNNILEPKKSVLIDSSLSVKDISSTTGTILSGTISQLSVLQGVISTLSVTNEEVSSLSAISANISSEVVVSSDISNLTANNEEVSNLTATNTKISSEVVLSSDVSNLIANNEEVSNLTATNTKISSEVVLSSDVSNLTVAIEEVSNLTATNVKISLEEVSSSNISNLIVANEEVSSLSAISANISSEVVVSSDISNLTAISANISVETVFSSNISILTAESATISSLNNVNGIISSLSAINIYVDEISARNLSIQPITLITNDVISVITNISETSGIIEISAANLIEGMVSGLTSDLSNISSAIQHKVCFISNDISVSAYNDLSVVKISKDDYEKLSPDKWNPYVIYIVESPYIDAYGEQIKNLAEGTEISDAVTLGQVRQMSSDIISTITDVSSKLSSDLISTITDVSSDIISTITDVSSKLSSDLISTISSLSDDFDARLDVISNDTSSKIYIRNYTENGVMVAKNTNLSILKVTEEEYENLINDNKISALSDVLFVVSSENTNVYGERIINVANGVLSNDAVTVNQMDSLRDNLSDMISEISSDIISTITDVSSKLSSDLISTITDVSSKLSSDLISTITDVSSKLSSDLISTINDVSSKISVELSNLSTEINNKIFIKSEMGEGNTNLSIIKLGSDEYADIVANDSVISNALYIVSSNVFNVYNEKIVNVADGEDANDAVNIKQLSCVSSSLSTSVDEKLSTYLDDYENLSGINWDGLNSDELRDLVKFIYYKFAHNIISSFTRSVSDENNVSDDM